MGDGLARAKPRRRIHWPAILTGLRIVLVVPVVALTLKRTDASDWVAFVAFGVAALTDGLDGYAARRLDMVSSLGQFWDPLADKILVTASMIGLVVVGRFPAWAAIVIVSREIAVTALRFAASSKGRGFPASIAGKFKTFAQLAAVLLYLLPPRGALRGVQLTVLGVAIALTVISAIDYFRRVPEILHRER